MGEFTVKETDWSVQSPDLNLIKHRWDELEQRLQGTSKCSPGWIDKITDTDQNLAESFPRKVEAVKVDPGPYYYLWIQSCTPVGIKY